MARRRARGDVARPEPPRASQALIELVDRHPGEVTVLAIGPRTNVATAMHLDPGWQHKVARVVWMGGAFELPDVLQELNAAYDPEATHMVMTSEAPLRHRVLGRQRPVHAAPPGAAHELIVFSPRRTVIPRE